MSGHDIKEWRALIGDADGDTVPFEYALTWMLDALREGLDGIPDGGVLLRHELMLLAPAPTDHDLCSTIEVAEKYRRRGRPVIAFRIVTKRSGSDETIAEDVIHLLWPRAREAPPANKTRTSEGGRSSPRSAEADNDGTHELLPIAGRITQDQIDRYARLSGDFNPLHVDPDVGRRSPFGSTIAHGPIPLGYLARAVREEAATDWPTGTKIDARFVAPSRPGDFLHVRQRNRQLLVEGDDGVARIVAEITNG